MRDGRMRVAIIGASGKTGMELVRQALERGYETVGVCRASSAGKLNEFTVSDKFTAMTAPVVSSESMLKRALAGCSALARISHKHSTAATDPSALPALRSVGALDVLQEYACNHLGRDALSGRRLRRLATNAGEKCGLGMQPSK